MSDSLRDTVLVVCAVMGTSFLFIIGRKLDEIDRHLRNR